MDKGNSVTFALENISLNKIHFELTDNFSYGDLEFNIELGYKEDEAEYLEKKLVSLRAHIVGGMEGAPVDILLFSVIRVSTNEQPYKKLVEESMGELAKPILNKASNLISNLHSEVGVMPTVIDLYQLYSQQK
ncbi:TPA: hypothetical protein ACGXYY_002391 [Enterococcus faecium]